MEEDIQMDELESIMSLDMDGFDEQPSHNQGQQAQPITPSSTKNKHGLNTMEASSSSKRQRVHVEENRTNKRPLEKPEQQIVSIKTEQVSPVKDMTTYHESSKRPGVTSVSTNKNVEPFEDDDASFIEVSVSVSVAMLVCLSRYQNVDSLGTHCFFTVCL